MPSSLSIFYCCFSNLRTLTLCIRFESMSILELICPYKSYCFYLTIISFEASWLVALRNSFMPFVDLMELFKDSRLLYFFTKSFSQFLKTLVLIVLKWGHEGYRSSFSSYLVSFFLTWRTLFLGILKSCHPFWLRRLRDFICFSNSDGTIEIL